MPTDQAVALETGELLTLLPTVSRRQLQWLAGEHEGLARDGGRGLALMWPLPTVQRLQVAVALQSVVDGLFRARATALPALLEAVLEVEEDPAPPMWAVYRDSAVTYVRYSADLAQRIGASGGVVVPITQLWPDTPADRPTGEDS